MAKAGDLPHRNTTSDYKWKTMHGFCSVFPMEETMHDLPCTLYVVDEAGGGHCTDQHPVINYDGLGVQLI